VGLCIAALVLHTWLAMGLIVPVTVAGSSMAPTLVGPHQEFHCNRCDATFSVGLDEIELILATECPHCASRSVAAQDSRVWLGDRLVIDRTAYTFRAPRRWEVIVFRSPAETSEFCIKRVVGLPGEAVSLVDGDVWINGHKVDNPRNTKFEVRRGDYPQQGDDRWMLGSDEFFVLGDNEAISDDSRSWLAGGGLDAKLVVGKPLGVR
jgi:signal peptidase I